MENKNVNLIDDTPRVNFNSHMIMLNIISRFREDYRNLFPNETKINKQITDLLHSIAWKVKDEEDRKL